MRELPEAAEEWVHGRCYPFALALHERTGWPMRGLTAVRNGNRGVQIAHLWILRPDGTAMDAGGSFDEAELTEDFLRHESEKTRASAKLMDFADRESFLSYTREIEPRFYEHALSFLDRMSAPAAAALERFAGEHLSGLLEETLDMAP